MYESYFHLSGKPFQLNPDPSFYFGSRGHKRAFAYLEYGLYQSEGFIIITGEVGAGKTTIVRSLLEQLDAAKVVAAQLVSTQLEADDLLRAVAMAFGLPALGLDKATILASLETFLGKVTSEGKRALLIVDEAQNLSPRAVEELRMLSNFQYGDQALLQSFLVGQPELRDLMQSPQMQQLRQRVIASYHLGPLDSSETQGYIEHRLRHVGWADDPKFDPACFPSIHGATGGIPRRINTLCNRLLLAAFLSERHELVADDVHAIVDELKEELGGGGTAFLRSRVPRSAARRSPVDQVGCGVAAHALRPHRRADRAPRENGGRGRRPAASLASPGKDDQAGKSRDPALMNGDGRPTGPLACVVGARPNYMKMAPLLRAFAARADLPASVLVHTGQHYDVAMNERLFNDLELPAPDINLEAGSGSHAVQTAEIMQRFEPVLDRLAPSCVIVVGDVNSTLACSLVATKKAVRVVHIEAGLRSFDRGMPEEINRVLTDQIADRLYTTERAAEDNLAREGIPAERIRFAGNVMIDSLLQHRKRAVAPAATLANEGIAPGFVDWGVGYGVVTLHRPSNVDDPRALRECLALLAEVGRRCR